MEQENNSLPFAVAVDGAIIDKPDKIISGEKLVIKILPKKQWGDYWTEIVTSERTRSMHTYTERPITPVAKLKNPVQCCVFEYPQQDYCDLEKHVNSLGGQDNLFLGDIPTLKCYKRKSLSIKMKKGYYYLVCFIGLFKGEKQLFAWGQLLNSDEKKAELLSKQLTFDTMKMMAIYELGLSLEEAKKILIKVSGNGGVWSEHSRLFITNIGFSNGMRIEPCSNGSIAYNNFSSKKEILEFLRNA
jgi:hypothetical protein